MNFLRRPEVEKRIGLSRSAIYQMMARGQFPKPVRLGPASVAWLEEDVTRWQSERIAATHDANEKRRQPTRAA